MPDTKNIVVLVSGGGTNLQALIDAEKRGELGAGKITCVIASKADAYALTRAENNGIKTRTLIRKEYKDIASYSIAMRDALLEEKADLVRKDVYDAIGDTALKIDELSGGITEIARNFTKSVEEVELRIKALTGDMSKTAQLLISESGIITESQSDNIKEVEYDFLTNKSDDDGILDV